MFGVKNRGERKPNPGSGSDFGITCSRESPESPRNAQPASNEGLARATEILLKG